MNRIVAACFALVLAPATAAFAVDTDAVIGGAVGGGLGAAVGSEVGGKAGAVVGAGVGAAVGTAVMANDDDRESRRRTRTNHVQPLPQREVVYVEALPPPPRIIHVYEPRYGRIPLGHAKHWKKHKNKYR